MATEEFNCPNCGAPLDYQGAGATMRCPYCETSVVVPPEMRTQAQPVDASDIFQGVMPVQSTVVTIGQPQTVTATSRRGVGCLVGIILVVVILFAGAMFAIPLFLTTKVNQIATKVLEPVQVQIQDVKLPTGMPEATEVPAPTEVPPSPTPGFASLVTTFGSSGIGPGLLNRAVYITVDGSGTVYVADYMDGRIQAFDPGGKFLHGWQVGDSKTIIYGLAATHDGTVYVAYNGDIYRFEGSSGKALGKLDYGSGPEFGDLTALPDGGVLGVWYQGRWGMITSLEGHRDDLVWFDSDGRVVRTLESAISGQTGELALETTIAVDGLGAVYALSSYDGAVFKFTPQGKFVDRFGDQGSKPGQISQASCIAVDGQGRVYVGGGQQVAIFSPEGQFIQSFTTDNRVEKMAFSEQGDLYIVSRDTVSRYTLGDLP